jgi:hypothetical protein
LSVAVAEGQSGSVANVLVYIHVTTSSKFDKFLTWFSPYFSP